MSTTADKLAAAETFAASWSLDLADEIAQHISCYEIEDLARLLRAHGRDDAADGWIAVHARYDDEGDTHYLEPTDTEPAAARPGSTIATTAGVIIATTRQTLTY